MNGLDGVWVALLVVVSVLGFMQSCLTYKNQERGQHLLAALVLFVCLFAAGWIARGAL